MRTKNGVKIALQRVALLKVYKNPSQYFCNNPNGLWLPSASKKTFKAYFRYEDQVVGQMEVARYSRKM